MISKTHKLKLRKITNFFYDCDRQYTQYFLVFHQPSDNENTKIVVIIPKKNIKLRVHRTKIKRQIYSLSLPLVKKSRRLNIALVANKKIITADKQALMVDLAGLFSRLSIKKQ